LTQYIVNRGPEGYASYCYRLTQKFKINGPRSSVPSKFEFFFFFFFSQKNVNSFIFILLAWN